MSELFKSKAGWLLAGIHLILVFTCLLYVNLIDNTSVLPVFTLMILTAPWWIFLAWLRFELGILADVTVYGDLLFNVYAVIGALINAFILYLLGFLLAKAFNYLSLRKSKP